jgi:polyhydroxyalkanoate synthesis repressor PhaR
MDTPRVSVLIKRYANRKLYNTESSCYITLRGVSELVRAGRDISVIDKATGQDITPVVLSQILVDDQKQTGALPHSVISELIQRSGAALSGVRENVRRWSDGAAEVAAAAAEGVARAIERADFATRADLETLGKRLEHVEAALRELHTVLCASTAPETSAVCKRLGARSEPETSAVCKRVGARSEPEASAV